ncbi:hypothetical protein [Pontibacter akesuensis]|uniref:Uncharacterized protein n=1 Tax=Pontibacter akesuensis TaxID=388950 RepID=A0A1I7GPL6_9BACT|nr:hypothetical protein [Pontibacter akesuensis]GHA55653.1 hypothetical protein GCM10007389_03980 [Pontibacter akesuensis]SFU50432.1 hypothetical protein SAMN04487941_1176 [Pontibacter akesuensis]
MTARLTNLWSIINKGLTFVNAILFGVVFGGMAFFDYKKERYKQVPAWANILLLLLLGFAAIVSMYNFL